MMRSKIIACFLCLTLAASAVIAQESQPHDSLRLKRKIEEVESAAPKSGTTSVSLTYKRTLLRRYEQYIFSLQQDIEDLRKIRATLDDTDSDEIKEINADIERVTKEHEATVEKARSLRDGAQEKAITQHTPDTTLSTQRAQPPCLKVAENETPVGLIWCWDAEAIQHKLKVQELAERVAPILWFSPDEPLLKERLEIPQALPGDNSVASPVVYYRISHLVLDRSAPRSYFKYDEELELKNIKGLTLKYYFYYPEDTGFNGHPHDLESARFDIHFSLRKPDVKEVTKIEKVSNRSEARADPGYYYVAQISRVVGDAHGVSWYQNILDIAKDTSRPITLFVEEGKHATCPDRNADGFYSPGYDVNRRYNDAWGVRDIISTGEVGGVAYDASKTKPRKPDDMIMVAPTVVKDDLLHFYGQESNKEKLNKRQGYNLKRVDTELVQNLKAKIPALEKPGLLINFIAEHSPPEKSHGDSIFERAVKYGYGIESNKEFPEALTFTYRYDNGHGFSFSPPIGRFPIRVFGGYVLPKANFILFGNDRRYSLEALYAPSAARILDWYATIGSEWLLPRLRDPDAKRNFDAKFVSEGGIKFRFNFRSFLLGGRLGLRTTGRDQRVVFEFGAAAF